MKSSPGQGPTVISKKIRPKQNDHARRRTQRSPHTRREQHRPSPDPTLAASSTPPPPNPSTFLQQREAPLGPRSFPRNYCYSQQSLLCIPTFIPTQRRRTISTTDAFRVLDITHF